MNTNFEQLRIPQLQNIHNGITHKKEVLQQKMAEDMERPGYYDILPRNYSILPIEKCSIHDVHLLEELHEKAFDCFWTMQKKKATEKGELEKFQAEFKFWSFMDVLTDEEQDKFFVKVKMSSLDIIQCMIKNPHFLNEVIV